MSPAPNNPNDKTYCILSLYLVKLCGPYAIFNALNMLILIINVALGDKFQEYFYFEEEINCSVKYLFHNRTFVNITEKLTYDFMGIVALTILML